MGIIVAILLFIVICFAWRVSSYVHCIDMEGLRKDMQHKIDEKDKYIDQLLSELRYKQYEVDNLRGYKSY